MSHFGSATLWPFKYETRPHAKWRRFPMMRWLPYQTGSKLQVDIKKRFVGDRLKGNPHPDHIQRVVMINSKGEEINPSINELGEWYEFDFGLASFSGEYRIDVMSMSVNPETPDIPWKAIPGYMDSPATLHVRPNLWAWQLIWAVGFILVGLLIPMGMDLLASLLEPGSNAP